MSYADEVFIKNCKDILENGFSTENEKVRPVWEDGTPAYTVKKFGVVNRYDLSKEFPILTLRYTNWKAAIDEMLWIWQKKSNRVEDLNSHIWDSWMGEDGTIGKAYGYQLGIKNEYKEGMFDQVDRVLYDLKNNPYSLSLIHIYPGKLRYKTKMLFKGVLVLILFYFYFGRSICLFQCFQTNFLKFIRYVAYIKYIGRLL